MRRGRLKLSSGWFNGLLVVVGVTLAAVVGCTLTDDLTGVGLDRNGPTTCIKACNDAAKAAREQCKREHETARELCMALPEAEQGACLAETETERDECNAAANAAKQECQDNCAHHQGGGSAG
jgi:hypothetical protein